MFVPSSYDASRVSVWRFKTLHCAIRDSQVALASRMKDGVEERIQRLLQIPLEKRVASLQEALVINFLRFFGGFRHSLPTFLTISITSTVPSFHFLGPSFSVSFSYHLFLPRPIELVGLSPVFLFK